MEGGRRLLWTRPNYNCADDRLCGRFEETSRICWKRSPFLSFSLSLLWTRYKAYIGVPSLVRLVLALATAGRRARRRLSAGSYATSVLTTTLRLPPQMSGGPQTLPKTLY